MKKVLPILLVLVMLFTNLSFAAVDVNVTADAAVIIEQSTGRVIYNKNMNKKEYPASITKILTALIVMEECELQDKVTVSKNAVLSVPSGSSIAYLKTGEEFTVEQLLYAMLVPSGNDAANVLAEHVSGSIEAFAEKMNQRAEELGCKGSHFVNANGLHDDNHYVTAYDMAIIAKEAMTHEIFRTIVSVKTYTMPSTDIFKQTGDNERVYNSTNLLLFDEPVPPNTKSYYYEYATGIKTGYTSKAGNTLVASASKNGMNLICVLLNVTTTDDTNRYIEAKNLFEYVFENYKLVDFNPDLSSATTKIENSKQKLSVKVKDGSTILTDKDLNLDNLTPKINLKSGLAAPIAENIEVGTVEYEIDGEVYKFDLVAANEVKEKAKFGVLLLNFIWLLIKFVFFAFVILVIVAIIIRIVNQQRRNKKRQRRFKQ